MLTNVFWILDFHQRFRIPLYGIDLSSVCLCFAPNYFVQNITEKHCCFKIQKLIKIYSSHDSALFVNFYRCTFKIFIYVLCKINFKYSWDLCLTCTTTWTNSRGYSNGREKSVIDSLIPLYQWLFEWVTCCLHRNNW